MVDIEYIKEMVFKCYSIKEIQSRLSIYSRDERTSLLQGRLTEGEWIEYNQIINEITNDIKDYEDFIDKIDKEKLPMLLEHIQELKDRINEKLFQYDRRIIENYTIPLTFELPSDFDIKKFQSDPDDYDRNRMFDDDSTIGDVERAQIEYQQEDSNFTKLEKSRMNEYYFNSYGYVNTRLWEGHKAMEEIYYDRFDDDEMFYYEDMFPKIVRSLDNCINKTKGLKNNTRLYRAGAVDIHLAPGMHGTLKGYSSTSFQKETAKRLANENAEGYDWTIEILAPKGTKGVCANDHTNFNNNSYTFEHEYTLGRNTGYTVLSMDYKNKRQVILLDAP